MDVYEPREDSFLLQNAVKKRFNPGKHKLCLDMGTGSGIITETLKNLGAGKVVSLDISPRALKNVGTGVLSDLFSGISGRFDFIAFNPPYLPDDGGGPDNTTIGGPKGFETALRFLDQLPDHLSPRGECLLLVSTLTGPEVLEARMKNLGLKFKIISRKKMFFEELQVYLIE